MTISNDNIELLIFQFKEGLLDDTDRAILENALAENEEWRQMAEMYDPSLQLPQYPHIEYTNKDKLRAIANRRTVIPIWSRVAAACAIIAAIVLCLSIINSGKFSDNILASNSIEVDTANKLMPEKRHDSGMQPDTLQLYDSRMRSTPCDRQHINNESTIESLIAEKQEDSVIDLPEYLYTDKLITFLDDDSLNNYTPDNEPDKAFTSLESSLDIIGFTDKLITFYDDPMPLVNNTPYSTKPEWQTTVNDWLSNIQLARLEFQTDAINNLCKWMKKKNE